MKTLLIIIAVGLWLNLATGPVQAQDPGVGYAIVAELRQISGTLFSISSKLSVLLGEQQQTNRLLRSMR